MNRLYFDYDGTVAEFRKGVGPDVYAKEGYSRTLKPYTNVVEGIKLLMERRILEPCVISAVMPYKYVIDDKNWWFDKYLPAIPVSRRYYVEYGTNKSAALKKQFGARPGDIFLDDYNPNLFDVKYNLPGVLPIKLVNNINNGSGEWHGAMVHAASDPEEIALTLHGLMLANQMRFTNKNER